MSKKEFTVTSPDGKKVSTHSLDVEFKPEQWELAKALNWINSNYPCQSVEIALKLMYSGEDINASRLAVSTVIPHVLHEFVELKPNATLKVCLYIVACYWYSWGGGPKPHAPKSVPTHRVSEKEKLLSSLSCPLCNAQYTPAKSLTAREDILTDFSRWMTRHAKTNCQSKLTTAQAKKQAELEQAKKDQLRGKSAPNADQYYMQLAKTVAGNEIVEYIRNLRTEVDRMEQMLKEAAAVSTDNNYFRDRWERFLKQLESRKLKEDQALNLSLEDKLTLGGLYNERVQLQSTLANDTRKTYLKKAQSRLNVVAKLITALEHKGKPKSQREPTLPELPEVVGKEFVPFKHEQPLAQTGPQLTLSEQLRPLRQRALMYSRELKQYKPGIPQYERAERLLNETEEAIQSTIEQYKK